MATIYKRGKTWYCRFKRDGEWEWKSLKTTDETTAKWKRGRIERGIYDDVDDVQEAAPAPAPETPVGLSFADLSAKFEEWSLQNQADNTRENRLRAIKLFTEQTGLTHLSQVTPDHVEAFKAWRRVGKSVRTVNESLQSLKATVNRAKRQRWYVGENPFEYVDLIPQPKKHPLWLDAGQITTVLEVARKAGRDIYLVYALGIYAGLRKQEIVNAQWDWIDWKLKLIHVRQDECFDAKDGEDRTIPLSDKLHAILSPLRKDAGYIVAPGKVAGKHIYRFDFKKGFATVAETAKVPWCTPHKLRHTFASQLVSAGVDLFKVSIWLGHSSVKTTQIYAHLKPYDNDINKPA